MPVYTYATLEISSQSTIATGAWAINGSGRSSGITRTPAAFMAFSIAAAFTPPSTIPWAPTLCRSRHAAQAEQI
jgi:hypothetical protein